MTTTNVEPHGVPGQLNVYVLDVDSEATGYGAHNRLSVFGDIVGPGIMIREDIRGLPESTGAQRSKVANGWQRMHPKGTRLTYVESERYQGRRRARPSAVRFLALLDITGGLPGLERLFAGARHRKVISRIRISEIHF